MQNVTITAVSDSGWIKIYVDGNEVLGAPGSTTISLGTGTHDLDYYVQGSKGDTYRVSTSEPWDSGLIIMSGRHSGGGHEIIIP